MAVVAVAFFACTPSTETGLTFSLVYDYEMNEDGEILPNTGRTIKDGDVIDVTMEHFDDLFNEMVAHVLLINNASSSKVFTMKEVRNYDYLSYEPSLCVQEPGAAFGNCVTAIKEQEQLWEIAEIDAKGEMDLAMHLRVGGYVDGELVLKESANCPGVFTVSNGTESITFTLNFVYDKEVIPAQ